MTKKHRFLSASSGLLLTWLLTGSARADSIGLISSVVQGEADSLVAPDCLYPPTCTNISSMNVPTLPGTGSFSVVNGLSSTSTTGYNLSSALLEFNLYDVTDDSSSAYGSGIVTFTANENVTYSVGHSYTPPITGTYDFTVDLIDSTSNTELYSFDRGTFADADPTGSDTGTLIKDDTYTFQVTGDLTAISDPTFVGDASLSVAPENPAPLIPLLLAAGVYLRTLVGRRRSL